MDVLAFGQRLGGAGGLRAVGVEPAPSRARSHTPARTCSRQPRADHRPAPRGLSQRCRPPAGGEPRRRSGTTSSPSRPPSCSPGSRAGSVRFRSLAPCACSLRGYLGMRPGRRGGFEVVRRRRRVDVVWCLRSFFGGDHLVAARGFPSHLTDSNNLSGRKRRVKSVMNVALGGLDRPPIYGDRPASSCSRAVGSPWTANRARASLTASRAARSRSRRRRSPAAKVCSPRTSSTCRLSR